MNTPNKCGPMPLDEKAFAEGVDQACCAVSTGSAFDRKQWEESPECRRCFTPMSLNEGCEWSHDDRALLCTSCLTVSLENALAALDAISSPNKANITTCTPKE